MLLFRVMVVTAAASPTNLGDLNRGILLLTRTALSKTRRNSIILEPARKTQLSVCYFLSLLSQRVYKPHKYLCVFSIC
jgi:hypothetical protein